MKVFNWKTKDLDRYLIQKGFYLARQNKHSVYKRDSDNATFALSRTKTQSTGLVSKILKFCESNET